MENEWYEWKQNGQMNKWDEGKKYEKAKKKL